MGHGAYREKCMLHIAHVTILDFGEIHPSTYASLLMCLVNVDGKRSKRTSFMEVVKIASKSNVNVTRVKTSFTTFFKSGVYLYNDNLRPCIHRLFPCGVCPCSLLTRHTDNEPLFCLAGTT